MTAIQVSEYSDSTDVLKPTPLPFSLEGELPANTVLVEMRFTGLNFIDVYYRTGLYKKPSLPFTVCDEGCGVVLRVADGVSHVKRGDMVAFFRGSTGAAASHAIVQAADVYPVPVGVSDAQAAAVLLQGATAHYLTYSCFPVKKGDVVVVQAAAGGTGLIICQLCANIGATVIGVCGGSEKADLVTRIGRATHVVDYVAVPEWDTAVLALAPSGVDVVFDGVGKATFLKGLKVLRRRGHMITFGNASGPVDPIAPLLLTQHGSITLQRPSLKDFAAPGGEIEGRVSDLFRWIAAGQLTILTDFVFSLRDVTKAFEALEGRKSTGKVLLRCDSF